MARALAIDIGGTKLAAGVVDNHGRVLRRGRISTPRSDNPETVFQALRDLVAGLGMPGAEVCGVACGGPMTQETVSPLHIPAWQEFPLRSRLSNVTGLPTFIDNDAKAFALGEGWRGAAAGERNFIGMVVSTGVGGGIVADGALLDGASANAGHIGHIVVRPGGRRCSCGARGCLDAEASGTAIAAALGQPSALAPMEVKERTGRLVGRALGVVVTLLDLRLAVIGGSVALGFGRPFFEAARQELLASTHLAYARGARITRAALGSAGPLLGAACVGWRGTGRDYLGTHTGLVQRRPVGRK